MTSEIEVSASAQMLHSEQTVFERIIGVTEILLIRHGEAEPACRDEDGVGDPPLTERGLLQARRLAQRLHRDGGVARVYTSPLRRAQETATEIAFEIDRPLVTVYDLREVELRRHSGPNPRAGCKAAVPPAEIQARFQQSGRWDTLPAAEPSAELRARVRRAMDNIRAANPRRRVAVVCHGGVINAYLANLFGAAHDMLFFPRETSINTLRLLGHTFFIVRLNDVDHLHAGGAGSEALPAPIDAP